LGLFWGGRYDDPARGAPPARREPLPTEIPASAVG
jgi:hypothetical protein